jgi:hypothetical protein
LACGFVLLTGLRGKRPSHDDQSTAQSGGTSPVPLISVHSVTLIAASQ